MFLTSYNNLMKNFILSVWSVFVSVKKTSIINWTGKCKDGERKKERKGGRMQGRGEGGREEGKRKG
jgi:hypothetical protein